MKTPNQNEQQKLYKIASLYNEYCEFRDRLTNLDTFIDEVEEEDLFFDGFNTFRENVNQTIENLALLHEEYQKVINGKPSTKTEKLTAKYIDDILDAQTAECACAEEKIRYYEDYISYWLESDNETER